MPGKVRIHLLPVRFPAPRTLRISMLRHHVPTQRMGRAMDRLALTGFTLTILGAMGIVASELVGTAYAGLDARDRYLAVVTSGSSLRLKASGDAERSTVSHVSRDAARDISRDVSGETAATPVRSVRNLACSRLLDLGVVSLGLDCHGT